MRRQIRLLTLFISGALHAAVTLPALISDHMVLQQGAPIRIWGWAEGGERVKVTFLGQTEQASASAEGAWEVWLSPVRAGGPYELTISASNTITVRNVLVGEVWVASGQSNMAWALRASQNAPQEIAQANHPAIRFFQVKTKVADAPQQDVEGSWKICTPENAPAFSAVAYFFARELHQTRGVGLGVIQATVGGTPAQAWTARTALEANPLLKYYLDRWESVVAQYPQARERFEKQQAEFQQRAAEAKAQGKPVPPAPRPPRGAPGDTHTPSGLFNGMIAPLTPYAIRGVIWYQGEANAGPVDNELYRYLFGDMILDWRRAWGIGPFPFLWVQLAAFQNPNSWALLRDSQTRTLELANTGQALAIDVGESHDIHPKDKLTVGRRLALTARAIAYGEKIVYSGPLFRQLTKSPGALRVWFDHVGSGLTTRGGGPLLGFRIAGEDGVFYKAEAHIEGDTVVVSSPLVADPVAVQYAWENDPVATLTNREGLPATPFRTSLCK
ncbi:MAG: sialate O-acetylesterase [Bryobacteraceae bacterium]|nr:sialate O-acetylesterase [Bryobacteraceae bacterium]MDW8378015.1 sialate O-acetylesterase [Bryobacterales bacterium]